MNVIPSRLPGLVLIEPKVMHDERGWFYEAYQRERYRISGVPDTFVQDNVSLSHTGVLRGLHLQYPKPQGKLIQVLAGRVWDVAVDVRAGSPTYGEWEGFELSVDNHHQFFIPEGFAHGFVVLEGPAVLCYKCTDYYHAAGDMTLQWDDPELGIQWPVSEGLIVSSKDRVGIRLSELPDSRKVTFSAESR